MARRSGILLPIASLPSPFGIGDFGPAAFRFVDWLTAARQHCWEVLPLLLTDASGSPFSPPSSQAMNWMLVSPELLYKRGWLTKTELNIARVSVGRVPYGRVNRSKRHMIGSAWRSFRAHGTAAERRRFEWFRRRERHWLDDYCLFLTIKDSHHGKPWWAWPAPLRDRIPAALAAWRRRTHGGMEYYAFGQWLVHEQWNALRRYASQRGVRLIGDLPYGVMHDSVDVWANRALFRVHANGAMAVVSGAPPDVFYNKGQVWGNPLYNWRQLERTRFRWWLERLRTALDWYDEVRLDHVRGLHSVWTIPARRPVARRGRWERVPGEKLFRAVRHALPRAKLIAEDLGKMVPGVGQLLKIARMPGMRIVQFGFRRPLVKIHDPGVYPKNSVAYTGTHDMPPLRMWLSRLMDEERTALRKSFGMIPTVRTLIRTVLESQSNTAILSVPDLLELGRDGRLNTPGILSNRNWSWRLTNLPQRSLVAWLQKETQKTDR